MRSEVMLHGALAAILRLYGQVLWTAKNLPVTGG